MACCRGCRPRPPTPTFDVLPLLLILAVILLLLGLPRLFFSVPVVFEAPKIQINWALIATPLVLLAIVHWLSSMTYSSVYCWPVPPCKRCYHHSCKGCLPRGVACWLFCCFSWHNICLLQSWFVAFNQLWLHLLHAFLCFFARFFWCQRVLRKSFVLDTIWPIIYK